MILHMAKRWGGVVVEHEGEELYDKHGKHNWSERESSRAAVAEDKLASRAYSTGK